MSKKLLYITVNSKPESISSSKTIGREFVNYFLKNNSDFILEELDLYETRIPRIKYEYLDGRSAILNKHAREKLSEESRKEVEKIVSLCDQFVDADFYVIASPMWNLTFPAPLKEYLDCIIQDQKTIDLKSGTKPQGLLDDKPRCMLYIQASGAKIPLIFGDMILNRGIHYVKSMVKLLGVKKFKEILVSGTGTSINEKLEAENEAREEIEGMCEEISQIFYEDK